MEEAAEEPVEEITLPAEEEIKVEEETVEEVAEEPVEEITPPAEEEIKVEEPTAVLDEDIQISEALVESEEFSSEEIENIEELEEEVFTEPKEEELVQQVEEDSAEIEELEKSAPETSLDEEPGKDIEATEETKEEAPAEPTSFFDEVDEDESISLSGNELDDILQGAEIVEEQRVEFASAEESAIPTGILEEETAGLEETTETMPAEDIMAPRTDEESGISASSSVSADIGEVDKENLKTIIRYLDNLLDNLPGNKIKEFAESEYYDLYNKLLDNLGI